MIDFKTLVSEVDNLKEFRFLLGSDEVNYKDFWVFGKTSELKNISNTENFKKFGKIFSLNKNHKRFIINKRFIFPFKLLNFFPSKNKKCLIIGKPPKVCFESNKILPFEAIFFDQSLRPKKNYLYDPNFLQTNKDVILWLYNKLEDDKSKQTLLSLVKYRMTGNINYLKIADYPEYQHPIVCSAPGDVVIDGGAYTGDSIWKFSSKMQNRGTIYCFEPDEKNVKKLTKIVSRLGPSHQVVQKGLWEHDASLSFSSGKGSSSQISEKTQGAKIDVTSIDQFVTQNNIQKVGVIKLDIEGAEKEAIRGAINTIKKFKPKLMLSIYHKSEDLLAIPQMINEIEPGYKFYLGHHNYYHTETDLYAI